MNRMAVRANHVGIRMYRPPDICLANVFRMAFQTRVQRLLRREVGEGANRGFPAVRRHMRAPGSVAAFAAGMLRRFLPRCDRFIVRILIEVQPYVDVAGFADIAANIPIRGLRRCLSLQQQRQK